MKSLIKNLLLFWSILIALFVVANFCHAKEFDFSFPGFLVFDQGRWESRGGIAIGGSPGCQGQDGCGTFSNLYDRSIHTSSGPGHPGSPGELGKMTDRLRSLSG